VKLSQAKLNQLHSALLDAFNLPRMRTMLALKAGKDIDDIAVGLTRPETFLEVIKAAQSEDWVGSLVAGAIEINPTNEQLQQVAGDYLAPNVAASVETQAPARELERTIHERNLDFDLLVWLNKARSLQPKICRITYQTARGEVRGTGFLVGPDLVLTNQHVIAELRDLQSAKLQFDYFFKTETTLSTGVTYKLAGNWLVLSRPPSPVDVEIDPTELPAPSELDFALLRLAERAGDATTGGKDRAGEMRGWLRLPQDEIVLYPDDPLIVLQHRDGLPLKAAIESTSVLEYNGNRTRIRHRTNTEGGSSGSPCFDMKWNLVALHHSGDPNFDPLHKPDYNEAIPIHLIAKEIRDAGIILES
jgi:hypothetical protein